MQSKPLIFLLAALISVAGNSQDFHKMSFEQLPSLNTPRGVGQPMLLNDEVTIFGGHTTGTVVRHLNADDAEVPLLEDWMPIFNYSTSDDEQKIADYTYLIPATAQTLSTLISIGIIVLGVSYLLALLGIKKFERMVKE